MELDNTDSIEGYYRRNLDLRVTCRGCGHAQSLSPFDIMMDCRKRGLSQAMPDVVRRLRCSRCRSRDVFAEPVPRAGRTSMGR